MKIIISIGILPSDAIRCYIIPSVSTPHPSNAVTPVAYLSLTRLLAKLIRLVTILLVLTACVSAPVQEMSDARQAIYSAEVAGAAQYSPDTLLAAQRLLQEAQTRLETGAYDDARHHALDARDEAIKARERATTIHSPPP
ncbi:hypothetical protein BN874_850038 [Candidatus Contendobacter odensis Run_B_J11]|uniref:DUF4398 domain-containing protein n=1 Tax=Candidatus Contendobacter odensis Run_B_J11 TaxID=1400861 RepID=A0A7U7GG14_9GAMM|nr:hypothetical protein BN874_850038 [Candidatus Contendobacter odensis Run_B_J11]